MPKAGHMKAGRSDSRNQRLEHDTGKMRKIQKVPLTAEKPKGPRHTKNTTRSEFTICSEFTMRSDSLLKM